MRAVILTLSAAIFAGAIIVSYSHVYALMAFAGLHGVIAHLTVIVFELTFIAGTLAYAWNAVPRSVSLSAIGLGLLITLTGNVLDIVGHDVLSPTGATVVGVGIGVSIPLALIVAEVMVKQFLVSTKPERKVELVTSNADIVCTVEELRRSILPAEIGVADLVPSLPASGTELPATEPSLPTAEPATPPRMSKATRQSRIREFTADMSATEVAAILGVSERTVQRDREELERV